ALVCCLGAWRFWQGHLTQGQFVGYLAAYGALQAPVALVFSIGAQRGRALAGLERLTRLLSTTSSTPDPRPHVAETPPATGADLTLRDVRFSYVCGQPVLEDINLTIPFGQRIALVGPSGSGKSTLVKLLLRLYDPDGGTVAFGGIDLRRCRAAEVRQRFGVVPQDPYFFSTTIRENLLVMRPGATEAELRHVCELANAWEFIQTLPDRFDTLLGEGGARLSGGQRQRLAIARALLHDPRYLIFDEATSALDTLSERLVQDALGRILHGGQRTAVFIAHRLSTIKTCDRILVLQAGRIVQDGTFEHLAQAPGLFQKLVASGQL
ncbi:MAG: ABC transporter ATP-binding protein, partial [Verrucomicrobia bacterium]|nr:ABC transporter ATP-binding protein [Verrucomicrobiota bacterium]